MNVTVDMAGTKRFGAKYTQRANFLGGDGMREFLKETGKLFKAGIEERINTFTPGPVPDLSAQYKKTKRKQVGHVYPILVRTGYTFASMYVRVFREGRGQWTIRIGFAGSHPEGPRTTDIMRWHAEGAGNLPKRDWATISPRARADARADLKRRLAAR